MTKPVLFCLQNYLAIEWFMSNILERRAKMISDILKNDESLNCFVNENIRNVEFQQHTTQ